ncbi:MAG: cytochrome P450, partial [Pseudomonadota bacterium]|nr:cytochrome P450 [Pseudomonadota bacterium]
ALEIARGPVSQRGDRQTRLPIPWLTIWEMSANRDDRVFNNPFTFDIARMPNQHIGFGFGAHICLGAALARLELKVGLATLFERILDFEIEGPPQWVPNNRLLGLKRLPLRIIFKG